LSPDHFTLQSSQVQNEFHNSSNRVTTLDTGDLYTFGKGTYGVLGHSEKNYNHVKPKLVQFFKKNNLKVTDVACGEKFTLALTGKRSINKSLNFQDDGDVWSWGSGRRSDHFLSGFFPSGDRFSCCS